MLLRSKVHRENGTNIEMPGNRTYHFRFMPGLSDGPECHIAEVTNESDLGRLLGLPDLFGIYNVPAALVAPAAPAAQAAPDTGDDGDDGDDEMPASGSPAVAPPTFGTDWMKLATEGGDEGLEALRAEYLTRFAKKPHPNARAEKLAERLIEDETPAG
jgi:hypothetical protein